MGRHDVVVERVTATELHDAARALLDGLGVSFAELEAQYLNGCFVNAEQRRAWSILAGFGLRAEHVEDLKEAANE